VPAEWTAAGHYREPTLFTDHPWRPLPCRVAARWFASHGTLFH